MTLKLLHALYCWAVAIGLVQPREITPTLTITNVSVQISTLETIESLTCADPWLTHMATGQLVFAVPAEPQPVELFRIDPDGWFQ